MTVRRGVVVVALLLVAALSVVVAPSSDAQTLPTLPALPTLPPPPADGNVLADVLGPATGTTCTTVATAYALVGPIASAQLPASLQPLVPQVDPYLSLITYACGYLVTPPSGYACASDTSLDDAFGVLGVASALPPPVQTVYETAAGLQHALLRLGIDIGTAASQKLAAALGCGVAPASTPGAAATLPGGLAVPPAASAVLPAPSIGSSFSPSAIPSVAAAPTVAADRTVQLPGSLGQLGALRYPVRRAAALLLALPLVLLALGVALPPAPAHASPSPPSRAPPVRRRFLVVLVALACVASACGSSVLTERAAGTAGRAGSTRTASGGTVPGAAVAGTGASAAASGGGAVASGGGSIGVGAGVPAAAAGAAYKLGVPGYTQGITATSIKIGIPVIANAGAAAGLLGAANIRPGDNGVESRALVADVNARGGINGRKIDAQYYAVDFGNPASVEANALAACNHFADDLKVFAILMVINPPVSFVSCAAQKGVILLNGSVGSPDDPLIAQTAPWYYLPTLVSQSRIWGPLFDSVAARGVLHKGDKVAVFALDQEPFPRVAEQVVIPDLKARGYQVSAYERVNTEAAVQNPVLRFAQSGATAVVFVQASGVPDLLFMRQAEAQKYRPTYLMSSYDAPGYLLEGNVAPEQIAGVQGIGWEPIADVAAEREPLRPQETRCFQILTKGGEAQTQRQYYLTAEFMCDLVWSFEAITRAAGPQLSTVSFQAGYHSIGGAYSPATVFQTNFSTRVDGVSAFRPLGWVASCKCLQYVGPLQPLP